MSDMRTGNASGADSGQDEEQRDRVADRPRVRDTVGADAASQRPALQGGRGVSSRKRWENGLTFGRRANTIQSSIYSHLGRCGTHSRRGN